MGPIESMGLEKSHVATCPMVEPRCNNIHVVISSPNIMLRDKCDSVKGSKGGSEIMVERNFTSTYQHKGCFA